jgi:uncharacterized SAM-binding protein YcdF (DUF218 family)
MGYHLTVKKITDFLTEKGNIMNYGTFKAPDVRRPRFCVQKPYMERRTYATFKKVWSEKEIVVTSPMLSFEEYVNDDFPKDYVINVMVGDLQRIKVYPEKGFQIPQDIPENVWEAYEYLVSEGYTAQLIK